MINPLNIATRGATTILNKPLSLATDGYMSFLQGSFPFPGGGDARERKERLKREDDEILFILKEFLKWVS